MEKNRLILIGGCPGTGKTTLAIKLADKLGIDQVVSTDTVRACLKSVSDCDSNPFLFTVTHEAWKILGERTNENIWGGFLKHCEIIYSSLKFIINKSAIEGRDVIIEGAHLIPNFCKFIDTSKFDVHFFFLRVESDSGLIRRFDLKNSCRRINYSGWGKNLKIIRFIEGKIFKKLPNNVFVLKNEDLIFSLNKCLETIFK
ncbi:AAA family ATPase [archaeon]|jgi:2-phosphoglycerate kinase|nr:AAA family ATPase [archaeon]MBT4373650.1 AAA family ATPase [archaeon]MBT4531704.1 AAA family ATPase [archaeon]MBT7001816.1 AAA family ATPase [archaeon]MBT7281801.1 AAA family ATPase [archaeon]